MNRHWTGSTGRCFAVLMAALVSLGIFHGAIDPSRAQTPAAEEPSGNTYLTPFPPGDTYRVQVIGDAMAEALAGALVEGLGSEIRVQVQKKHRAFQGLLKVDIDEELKTLDAELARDRPHVAVVMLGMSDRISTRNSSGRRIALNSDEWRDEYGRRIDLLMKALKRRAVAIYWAGLPPMRRSEINDDAKMMNELIRERAYLNGVRYVDVYVGFADEDGEYTQMGTDIAGKSKNLRSSDGIYFTWPGYQKLGWLIEEEVKRDITLARAARNVPLAGSEAEQAKIRPKVAAGGSAGPGTSKSGPAPGKDGQWQANVIPPAQQARAAGILDANADNSRIALRFGSAGGREETVTIDILRPAIPAAIIALVTRREGQDGVAQQVGENAAVMVGPLAMIETITPGAEGGSSQQGRRRAISTQSPYFRAVIKGERMTPRPGRADDFAWPRRELALPVPPGQPQAPAAKSKAGEAAAPPPAKARTGQPK